MHNLICFLFSIVFSLCCSLSVYAGGGPEGVAVVVNGNSWASKTVANEYIALRNIPASNVIVLKNLPNHESINVEQFRTLILKPVFEHLEKVGVARQINCITYSCDVPVAINVSVDVGDKKLSKIYTKTAAINGLTYLYQPTMLKNPVYLNLNINWYTPRPAIAGAIANKAKPIAREDTQEMFKATRLFQAKKYDEAEKILSAISKKYPENTGIHYNLANLFAQTGKKQKAINALKEAVKNGLTGPERIAANPIFNPLKDEAQFKKLLTQIKPTPVRLYTQPSKAFHARDQWSANGQKVSEKGQKYLLSTVLAVTSGRGNSVQTAIKSLRRSAAADAKHPKGTIYFLKNRNVRSTTRERYFESAIAELKKLGVKAILEEGTIPQNKKDVMGAMIGTAKFDWGKSKSTILPGAICEHLTSLGGVMRENGGQTACTEYIRYGASGSSGTVTEPYALQAKFPLSFIHVHYARGCSLAESFYQSVSGPYQLLVVGDPLCQPWAKRVTVSATGLKANQVVKGEVTITPKAVINPRMKTTVDSYRLYINGRKITEVNPHETISFDSSKLADGHHTATLIATSGAEIETQSRLEIPFVVNNDGGKIRMSCQQVPRDSVKIASNKTITVKVKSVKATEIAVLHNSTVIGTVKGSEGTIKISLKDFGEGPITLRAVAKVDKKLITGAPLKLTIVAPPAMKGRRIPANVQKTLKPGLKLSASKGKQFKVIAETYKSDWLEKQKLTEKTPFELAGLFQVQKKATQQIQLYSNCATEIRINKKIVWKAEPRKKGTSGWVFIPVSLDKGVHQLSVKGTANKKPRLAIRLGGEGVKSLNKDSFRYSEK